MTEERTSPSSRHVFRMQYSDISRTMGTLPDVLLSVSNKFYEKGFIDLPTKTAINRPGGLEGASKLLDQVMMKVEQSDSYLPRVMDILREETALKDIANKLDYIMKISSSMQGHDASTPCHSYVPEWCELSFLQYEILPVYRTVKLFDEHKQYNDKLYSDPFYTSNGGYKMALTVYPNGYGSSTGTHVSVFINLMKGPNDDNLQFPITGIFTVQILNWKQNNHHVEKSIKFDDNTPIECRERVITEERADVWGKADFLSCDGFVNSGFAVYLNDQHMMSFKITFNGPRIELQPNSDSSRMDANISLQKQQATSVIEPRKQKMTDSPQSNIDHLPLTNVVSDQQSLPQIDIECQITVDLKTLNKTYNDLIVNLQKKIKTLVEEAKLTLDNLKEHLEFLYEFYDNCNISEVENTDELFKKLKSRECGSFFLDPEILEILANCIKEYDKELQSKVNNYVHEVNTFKKKTTLEDLKKKVTPLVDNYRHYSQKAIKIIFKLQNDWGKRTMMLVKFLLDELYPNMKYEWYVVEPGSVKITFIAHHQYTFPFIECCKKQKEFLFLVGVFSVYLDDNEIVSKKENVAYNFESALLKAAALRNIKAVKILSKACVNMDYTDSRRSGKTALLIASEPNKVTTDCVARMAQANVNVVSPVATCQEELSVEIAEILLIAKANVNHQDNDGNTALHYACCNKNTPLALLLAKHSANPLITNSRNETPFLLAVRNNLYEVVKSLAPKILSFDTLSSAFLFACNHGYQSIIMCLIDCLKSADSDFSYAVAFANGDVGTIALLPKVQLSLPTYKGVTPLMIAASCGHSEVVSYLIKSNVDVNYVDEEGLTPLVYAVNGKHSLQVIESLLKAKCNPFIKLFILIHQQQIETEKQLILQYAALYLHEMFTSIVKQLETDIAIEISNNKQSIQGCLRKIFKTSDHAFNHIPFLAKVENCTQFFNCIRPFCDFLSWKLVSSFSDCLKVRKYFSLVREFETNTELAAFACVTDFIPRNIIPSVDKSIVQIELNSQWSTRPLCDLRQVINHLLLTSSINEILSSLTISHSDHSLLVEYQMPKSQELTRIICSCVSKLRISAMVLGISKIAIDSVHVPKIEPNYSFSFESAVLFAVMQSEAMNYNEFPNLLKLLLVKMKLNPNCIAAGTTPLHCAIKAGNLKAVEILLEHNASFDVKDEAGETPFSLASLSGHDDIIHVLQKRIIKDSTLQEASAGIASDDIYVSYNPLQDQGNRALIEACRDGSLHKAEALLQNGVDPNALNNIVSFTALMLASFRGNTKLVELLLQYKADHSCLRASKEGLPFFDAFALACCSGNLETVNAYFNADDVHINAHQLHFGWYVSCLYNHPKVVEYLLEYLVDLPSKNKKMIEACIQNDVDFINNNSIQPVDAPVAAFGVTPLMIACACDSYEVANLLLKAGANKNKKDEFRCQACTFCDIHSPILIVLDQKDPRFDPLIDKSMICLHPPQDDDDDES